MELAVQPIKPTYLFLNFTVNVPTLNRERDTSRPHTKSTHKQTHEKGSAAS